MKKQIHFISLGCVLLTLIFITSSSLNVSAADDESYGVKLTVSTKNTFHYVYDSPAGTGTGLISYSPSAVTLNSNIFPNITDYGFLYRYNYSSNFGTYFLGNSNSYIMANSFDISTLGEYSSVKMSDFYYYLFTFFVGINYNSSDPTDYNIANVLVNNNLTESYEGDINSFFQETPVIVSDNISIKAYTYAISSRSVPVDSISESVTVGDLFRNLEIIVYPELDTLSSFNIYMSDISLKMYSETDVLAGGFADIEDAISAGTEEIVDAIQNQTDQWLNADADADPSVGSNVNAGTDDLGEAEANVKDMLTDVGSDTFVTIPTEFTQGISFIGSYLQIFLDSSFGVVVFFCLSFGVALTLVGRSVR